MKISVEWLREWVPDAPDPDELARRLTMAGLEVDGVEPAAPPFHGVVVGEIVEAQPHPDADRLRVCTVRDGQGEHSVVCGAPNAAAGLRVPYARPGAVLPGDVAIAATDIRGQASAGMLCAADELGLAEKADGLLELGPLDVGVDLRDALKLDDPVLELDLTPNRSDCLGMLGVAREVAALTGCTLADPGQAPVPAASAATFPIRVEAPEACPRFLGRVIEGVDLSRPTPGWMVERLRRAGVRSIDPSVDVTNYVMLELGQPMHAFDRARLTDGIVVRYPRDGETLELLDGQTVTPEPDTLLIADEAGPLSLAGIMGGEASGVDRGSTQDLFLECALFDPLALAGRARRHGLHTDASHRFERGVDFEQQHRAIERATELLLELVGGTPGPVVAVESEAHLPRRKEIPLRLSRLDLLLGDRVEAEEAGRALAALGLECLAREDVDGDVHWRWRAPSHRWDLAIEEDLIEEVCRLRGYDRVPVRAPTGALRPGPAAEGRIARRTLHRMVQDRGYQEAVTYSFVDEALQAELLGAPPAIPLDNPIAADMGVMRVSLIPGLIGALRRNLNHQNARVRLYETGRCFLRDIDGGIVQPERLGLLAAGPAFGVHWADERRPVDFYDVKGDLQSVLALRRQPLRFEPVEHPALHPGRSARIVSGDTSLGVLGELHPRLAARLDLPGGVHLAELELDAVLSGSVPQQQPVSRFPAAHRDVAVVVDAALPVGDLLDAVGRLALEGLSEARIFDVYAGEGIDSSKKSVALGLTFQDPSRTLKDAEVSDLVQQVVRALADRFGAVLRS